MRSRYSIPVLIFASTLALAGCQANDIERAGIGGVLGGVTSAAVGGNVATGVAAGAAAGALCDDVNLC